MEAGPEMDPSNLAHGAGVAGGLVALSDTSNTALVTTEAAMDRIAARLQRNMFRWRPEDELILVSFTPGAILLMSATPTGAIDAYEYDTPPGSRGPAGITMQEIWADDQKDFVVVCTRALAYLVEHNPGHIGMLTYLAEDGLEQDIFNQWVDANAEMLLKGAEGDFELPSSIELAMIKAGKLPAETILGGDLIQREDGLYIVYTSFKDEDLLAVLKEDNREYAGKVLTNEGWEYFENYSGSTVKEVLTYLVINEANAARLREKLLGESVVDDESGEEVVLTEENIGQYDLDDLLKELPDSEASEEVVRAYDDVYAQATEDEAYKQIIDTLMDGFDRKRTYLWMNDGEKVAFPVTLDLLQEHVRKWRDDNDEDFKFKSSFAVSSMYASSMEETYSIPENTYGSVTDELFNERLSELV